ncbi:MAG: DsbA family protein [Syntrophales bacterium]
MRYLFRTTKRLPAALAGRAGKGLGLTAAGTLLLLVLLIVPALTMPISAADPSLSVFGAGAIEVRVYTDYFCGPCRAEEQEVMAVITGLVAKNRIRVTFIDTPLHLDTILYAGYFLAAVNAKQEFGQAVKARSVLFEAAGLEIKEKEKLEGFLALKGLQIRPVDTAPLFALYSRYIREDRINSTPTVVISGPQGKQTLNSKEQILKGLRNLRK